MVVVAVVAVVQVVAVVVVTVRRHCNSRRRLHRAEIICKDRQSIAIAEAAVVWVVVTAEVVVVLAALIAVSVGATAVPAVALMAKAKITAKIPNNSLRLAAVDPAEVAMADHGVHHRSAMCTRTITHTLVLAIRCFKHHTELC